MSLTPDTIFEDARLLAHPVGFTSQVSPTQVLAHLTNLDNHIVEIVHQVMPSLLSTRGGSFTVSSSKNSNGYPLENATGYSQFRYTRATDDAVWEVYVVMESDFMTPTRHPSGMIVQGTGNSRLLIPVDPLGKAWAGDEDRSWWTASGDTITYRYIPLPSRLTALTDEMQSPDIARGYLVASTALLILQMLGGDSAQLQMFAQREQSEYHTLLMQFYKMARIFTPNRVSESTFYSDESIEILVR
jgi:hypothetical protein